jgi:hypothetical protein
MAKNGHIETRCSPCGIVPVASKSIEDTICAQKTQAASTKMTCNATCEHVLEAFLHAMKCPAVRSLPVAGRLGAADRCKSVCGPPHKLLGALYTASTRLQSAAAKCREELQIGLGLAGAVGRFLAAQRTV